MTKAIKFDIVRMKNQEYQKIHNMVFQERRSGIDRRIRVDPAIKEILWLYGERRKKDRRA